MRRSDREITDFDEMCDIFDECDCCRLGMADGDGAYIVPMNFGMERDGGGLKLYFHCAAEGKKLDLIAKNQVVGFEADTAHGLKTGPSACNYSYFYKSVMGRGKIRLIDGTEGKIHALDTIMRRFGGEGLPYNDALLGRVAVLELTVTEWSCKAH